MLSDLESCVDKPRVVKAAGIDFQVLDLVETNTKSLEEDITMPRRLADSMRALRPVAGIFTQGNRDIEIDTGGGLSLAPHFSVFPIDLVDALCASGIE